MKRKKQIACVEVTRDFSGTSLVLKVDEINIPELLAGTSDGDVISLTVRFMAQEEIDGLEEFGGW